MQLQLVIDLIRAEVTWSVLGKQSQQAWRLKVALVVKTI